MIRSRGTRRISRAVTLAAAAVVLLSPTVSASAVAPADVAARNQGSPCDPAGHREAVASAMARVGRADDQARYTPRDLRRIDRRLDRAMAHKESSLRSSSARSGLVRRIPVHAHVIDGTRSLGPSKRAVARQVGILNRAFDGGQSSHNTATRFRFDLVSFDRTRNQRWHTASLFSPADRELRRQLHQGGPASLNVYFSAPGSPQSGTVLGWSTMPWLARRSPRLDGVTIHQGSLPGGALNHYNLGDTTVHEVGHWLGLFHTFEGGCTQRNDRVADTPAEAKPSLTCPGGRDTCKAAGLDPIHNFMDYSFDSCMNLFTPDQVARMTDNWLAYRAP